MARYLQMCWLAGDDPMKLKAFEQVALLEYLLLLNKKIGDVLKENKTRKAAR